jgi:hypothetical protein
MYSGIYRVCVFIRVGQVVNILLRIQEIPGSNLSPETGYPY